MYSQMETSSLVMAPSVGLSLKGFDFGAVIVDLVDSPVAKRHSSVAVKAGQLFWDLDSLRAKF